MGQFYIIDKDSNVYELTATTDISIVEDARVSSHRLEDGNSGVDNIVNENVKITFTGIVTDIPTDTLGEDQVSSTNTNAVQETITAIRNIRNSKDLVTVVYDEDRFQSFSDCVITNLTLGTNANTYRAYEVTLNFEQIRLVSKAVTSTDMDYPDTTQAKTTSDGSTTEETDTGSVSIALGYEEGLGSPITGG